MKNVISHQSKQRHTAPRFVGAKVKKILELSSSAPFFFLFYPTWSSTPPRKGAFYPPESVTLLLLRCGYGTQCQSN